MKYRKQSSDWSFFSRGILLLFFLLLFGLSLSCYGIFDLTKGNKLSFLSDAEFMAESTLQNINLGVLWRRIEELIGMDKRRSNEF